MWPEVKLIDLTTQEIFGTESEFNDAMYCWVKFLYTMSVPLVSQLLMGEKIPVDIVEVDIGDNPYASPRKAVIAPGWTYRQWEEGMRKGTIDTNG